MKKTARAGVTLIELLVVIAIIAILFALQFPVFSRALRKAQETSISLTQRDKHIGDLADSANIARERHGPLDSEEVRERCRAAYSSTLRTGEGDIKLTELLLAVSNEAEFRAYWHTLINPNADWELSGSLAGGVTVRDESGTEYRLPLISQYSGAAIPISWELISTDLMQTTSGTLGGVVQYSDGHSKYVRYRDAYPMVPTVAELTRTFLSW